MESLNFTKHLNTSDETEALRDMARLYERMVMRRHTNGGYHNVVTELWRQCEAWNTGIVIMWQHVACKNMATVQGLLDEQGRELGLHLIWIPHDLMDPRTVSRRTIVTRSRAIWTPSCMPPRSTRPCLTSRTTCACKLFELKERI